jgi:hypothetical protein
MAMAFALAGADDELLEETPSAGAKPKRSRQKPVEVGADSTVESSAVETTGSAPDEDAPASSAGVAEAPPVAEVEHTTILEADAESETDGAGAELQATATAGSEVVESEPDVEAESDVDATEVDATAAEVSEVAEPDPQVEAEATADSGSEGAESTGSESNRSSAKTSSDRLPTEGEGVDWVAGDGTDAVPAGFDIKGNASSRIYHPVESSSYSNMIAEIYFATGEAAEKAGYRLPKNLQASGGASARAAQTVAKAAAEGGK